MVLQPGRNLAGHPRNSGDAIAAFTHGPFGAAERRVAGVWIDVLPSAIVSGVEDERILIETKRAYLVHDATDTGVELDDRVGIILLLDSDLWM